MTQGDILLQAILDDPDDDGIRLVYSDWLEEHGEHERAEFLRVQCGLARLEEDDPGRRRLLQREAVLLERHRHQWLAPLRAVFTPRPSLFARLRHLLSPLDTALPFHEEYGVEFRRGFLEYLSLPASEFLAHAPALFAAAPLLRDLYLWSEAPDGLPRLVSSAWLARVRRLHLGCDGLGQAVIEPLVGSPHLRQLRQLALSSRSLAAGGLRVLADSRLMCGLTSLGLYTSQYLGQSEWAGGTLAEPEMRALAESPECRNLQTLDLGCNAAGDGGAAALAASPYLSGLSALLLSGNRIGDVGAAALAASPYVSGLTVLRLDGNLIGDAGARALAASPHLTRLKVLGLRHNAIGRAGAIPLGAKFGGRVLLREGSPEDDP
jgi:uncharacterized protein (TIGR02996 family)